MKITSANAYVIEFPSYYGLDLKFSGTVSESYSNNIAFSSDNEDKQENFLTMLSIGLDMAYTGKKRSFGLSGVMQEQLSLNGNDADIPSEHLNLGFQNDFSDYDSISVMYTYDHTELPQTLIDEFGRYSGKLDQQNNAFSINYSKIVNKELTINTGYTSNMTSTKSSVLTDTTQNTLSFNTVYSYSELTNYNLSYSYTDSKTEYGRGVSSQMASVGISRYLTKSFSINASVGYYDSKIGRIRYTSEYYSISLVNEVLIDDKTTGSINYQRSFDVLKDQDEIFDNWRATMDFRREILEDFTGSFSCFYGQGKYLSSGDEDVLLGASTILDYKIWEGKKGQRMGGRLGYTYSKLESNVINRGYTRGSIDMGISANF